MTLHFADARPPCRVRFLIDAGGIRSATRRQLLGDAPIPRLRVGRVKVTAWQCPSSAPAPPQGEAAALGGSVVPGRGRPTERQPLPRLLELAASKVADLADLADLAAFDHPGGRPSRSSLQTAWSAGATRSAAECQASCHAACPCHIMCHMLRDDLAASGSLSMRPVQPCTSRMHFPHAHARARARAHAHSQASSGSS